MKRLWILFTVVLVLFLAACTPAKEEGDATVPAGDGASPETESIPALVTVTPTPRPAADLNMEETPLPVETDVDREGTTQPDMEVVTPVSVDLSKLTPAPTVVGTPQEMPMPGGIDPGADMLRAMSRDLANRLGINNSEVIVLEVEEVTWPDGSLGCPEPGFGYVQMLTPGFRVILEAKGEEYTYHAANAQNFVLCGEDGAPVPTPTSS